MQAGTIDDFLPNWSVVQQIQHIKQQMAAYEAESKGQEDKEGSEKENTFSRQHKNTPSEEAAPVHSPPHPEAHHDTLDHLNLADETSPVSSRPQEVLAPPIEAPAASTSRAVRDMPEEELVWQVRASRLVLDTLHSLCPQLCRHSVHMHHSSYQYFATVTWSPFLEVLHWSDMFCCSHRQHSKSHLLRISQSSEEVVGGNPMCVRTEELHSASHIMRGATCCPHVEFG